MATFGTLHKLAAAIAALVPLAISAAPCLAQSQPPPAPVVALSPDSQFQQSCGELEAVSTRCDFGVTWTLRDGAREPNARRSLSPNIQATPLSQAELRSLLPMVLTELEVYPESLLRQLHVSIVLAGDVWYRSRKQAAGAGEWPVVALSARPRDASAVAKAFHHELMHGILGLDHTGLTRIWPTLNPPGEDYGGKGSGNAFTVAPVGDLPGYLSPYAKSKLSEDIPETFAFLMTAHKRVTQIAAGDRYLAAKVRLLKQWFAAICPEMDERFWAARS